MASDQNQASYDDYQPTSGEKNRQNPDDTVVSRPNLSGYTVRRNIQGHAEAIEQDGYTLLILACGAQRNEDEVDRIVQILNGTIDGK